MTSDVGAIDAGAERWEWFDEIDLSPTAHWRRMGTRALGDRPLLLADEHRASELARKGELLAQRHGEVFAALPGAHDAGLEVAALVAASLGVGDLGVGDLGVGDLGVGDLESPGLHPLDVAGRAVQEDLCLLQRRDGDDGIGWYLEAASLCAPSFWKLADKIGRRLDHVHAPIRGYASELDARVNSLFDALADRAKPVWRRNWFLHAGNELFQPDRVQWPPPVSDDIYVRSERQVMLGLSEPVNAGWVLFTIRIQQVSVRSLVADPQRRQALHRFLSEAPEAVLNHRGVSQKQRDLLLKVTSGVVDAPVWLLED